MKNAISLDNLTVTVPDHVLYQEVDGELVLLDLENGNYYGLNAVGARFWTLAQEHGGQTGRILEALLEEFDVSREQIHEDMSGFLTELERRGLVTIDERNSW